MANFVENQSFEHTQPDGTILNLLVTGDEYYHRAHDENGYTILQHPETGYAVYAVPDGNTITYSNYVVGRIDPTTLGIEPNLVKLIDESEQRTQDNVTVSHTGNRATPTGTINNIVCFLRFHDQTEFPQTTTYNWYNNLFNSTSQQSLADYYDEVSNGQLDINSYVYSSSGSYILSIQVSHDRGYYSPYNATTNTIGYSTPTEKNNRHWALFGELCTLVDPLVPAGIDPDSDNDGVNDALTFIIRGATDAWQDILWPAHYSWGGTNGSINGVAVWHYVFNFEGALGASVVCHEMGHMIGFPDLYHYTPNVVTPVGTWSLMASDNAQHETAYEKWKYGTWFSNIPTITPTSTPTQYTLTAIDQNPYSCYKIASNYANQFYMLEYRRDTGRYESGIPGSGLIAYRVLDYYPLVGGSDFNGNASGPPDEIYVYRPGGDIDTNGTINSANLSSSVGRTTIHTYTEPKPWIFVDTTTQVAGNLVITDIGASGGATITFKVSNNAPNIWDGSQSTAWTNAANWSKNSVPDNDDYVEIPGSMTRYPVVSTSQTCKNLIVKSGSMVTISTGNLHVLTNYENSGTLSMNSTGGVLDVDYDINWNSGSAANITNANTQIYCGGDMTFQSGSNVQFAMGYLEFNGTSSSSLTNLSSNTQLNHLRSNVSSPAAFIFSSSSTQDIVINGNLWSYEGKNTYCYYTGNIILKGSLTDFSTSASYGLLWHYGTLVMDGTSPGISLAGTAAYVNNLTLSQSGTVSLNSGLTVRGNLTIDSGTFSPGSQTIKVAGNWINNVGPTAFSEGTSRVIFNGAGHQYCNKPENFYTLEVNNGAALRLQCVSSTDEVTCAVYDWTAGGIDIIEGTFTVNDLADNAIQGGWYCNTGGTINISNPAPGEYIDLRGDLHIFGGNVNIYGGSTASYWPYLEDALIEMTGGILDFKDQGVYLSSSYNLAETITGGTIKVARGFMGNRTDFNPTGGFIELDGSIDASVSLGNGSNLYNLRINKSAARDEMTDASVYETDKLGHSTPLTRTNNVTATTNLDINGYFYILAGTFAAPDTMYVRSHWYNDVGPTAFVEGTGLVVFDGNLNSLCATESFYNLELNKTSTYYLKPQDTATVTSTSYNWTSGKLYVTGGTFTALDMVDSYIFGTIEMTSGYIHFHQTTDQYLDLMADITISGGELHLYGISGDTYWPYSGNASLTMSNGVIDVHDTGIRISSGNIFTTNITGGIIRTVGNFSSYRADFTPAGGSIVMYSTADAYVVMSSGTLYNLEVNKGARDGSAENQIRSESERRDREGNPITVTRSNTVLLSGNMICTNDLILQTGIFKLSGFTANVGGDLIVYGTLTMDNAADHLVVADNIYWYGTAVSQVTLGIIDCTGSWLAYVGANVVIPATNTTNFMSISTETIYLAAVGHQFGNLNINGSSGATYNTHSANTQPLIVSGNLAITAGNELDLTYSDLTLTGALDLDGKLDVHTQDVTMQGKPDFAATSELNITSGSFTFYDSTIPRTTYLRGDLIIDSGTFDAVNNSLALNSGSETLLNSGIIRCDGINATVAGTFQPVGGTVEFTSNVGGAWYSLNITNGNYLPNLIVNTATGIILANHLSIHGNFRLQAGNFDVSTSNFSLFVSGDWQNDAGETFFNERNGMISFSSGGEQTILTDETFYNFNLDNSSINWDAFELNSGCTLTVLNNLQISDGTLEMNPNSVVTTYNMIISTNAGLNAFGDANLMINVSGDWTDYNTSYDSWIGFYPGTSTVTFNGSLAKNASTSMFNLDFYNLIINKPVTVNLNLYDPVKVRGNLTITGGDWNDNGAAFIHQVYGNVLVETNGAWMSNSQNTLQMKGSGDTNITYNGSGGYFYNVTIDKTGSRDYLVNDDGEAPIAIQPEPTRAMQVTLQTNILLLGLGNLLVEEGTLNLNNHYVRCTGNVTVNNGGVLNISDNGWLEVGSGYALTVNTGGRLSVIGSSGNEAKVTHYAGYYNFNVESGATIAARYAIFEFMAVTGVNVKTGSIIDASYPFDNCIFRNGANAGTLLTINNNETHTISDVIFPVNTWGGSYNVFKSAVSGLITFMDASDGFSGETYDYDPNNLINWEISSDVDLEIQAANWSNPTHYVGDSDIMQVTVVNNGTTDITSIVYLDLYMNQTIPPITGEIGDFYIQINSIPPGAPLVFEIPAFNYTEGPLFSWIQIDTDEIVDETNEGNNVFGPVSSTWLSLPEITDLNIELVSPDTAHLYWTYPMSVTRFNVYRSINPYFIPGVSNLLVHVAYPTTEYTDTTGGDMFFYIVTAEQIAAAAQNVNQSQQEMNLPRQRNK